MRFFAIFLLALLALQGFMVMAADAEDAKQHAENAAGEIKEGAKDMKDVGKDKLSEAGAKIEMPKKTKPTDWSRDYFTKKDDGKFECNFGCGAKYAEAASKFKNHLLNQCQKIGPKARAEINQKAGLEPAIKKPKLDLFSISTASVSAPTTPKASTSFGLGNFIDHMDDKEQDKLDELLTKALITGNVPANFLDNPFFKQFMDKLRPSYKLPSHNSKFSKTLIPAEYERVQKAVEKATSEADFLSMSSDGWTDIKGSRLINVIAHTPKPFLFNSIDATQDIHDAPFICQTLSAEIEKLGPQKLVAMVTDNAPNMKAAWKLLSQKYPWIVFEGCKAHGLDLAAKDLCKFNFVADVVQKCVEIAKFFRKTIPKSVLEETQNSAIGHSRLLILPVATRWFSNWTLLNSVKENEACLKSAIWSPKIVDNAEIKKKPERLSTLKHLLCEDTEFWANLALVEELLNPLKTAILAIEGSVIDVSKAFKVVESAFEKTVGIASKFSTEQKEEIVKILNARRDFCSSDLMHVFDLLNPNVRGQGLTPAQETTAMDLLRSKLLKNPAFVGRESKIFVEVAQFKAQTGEFDKQHWGWQALETGELDALTFWTGCFSNTILATVFKMLQIIPITSAATERNWSIRGATHTKVRNRLAIETASKLTFIKHNLILEHPDLFKTGHRQEAETPEDEVANNIVADDVIIEDC